MSFIILISGIILRRVLAPVQDFLFPTSCIKKMEEIVKNCGPLFYVWIILTNLCNKY